MMVMVSAVLGDTPFSYGLKKPLTVAKRRFHEIFLSLLLQLLKYHSL